MSIKKKAKLLHRSASREHSKTRIHHRVGRSRAVGRSKNWGFCSSNMVGIICPILVEIGFTYLPKSGHPEPYGSYRPAFSSTAKRFRMG